MTAIVRTALVVILAARLATGAYLAAAHADNKSMGGTKGGNSSQMSHESTHESNHGAGASTSTTTTAGTGTTSVAKADSDDHRIAAIPGAAGGIAPAADDDKAHHDGEGEGRHGGVTRALTSLDAAAANLATATTNLATATAELAAAATPDQTTKAQADLASAQVALTDAQLIEAKALDEAAESVARKAGSTGVTSTTVTDLLTKLGLAPLDQAIVDALTALAAADAAAPAKAGDGKDEWLASISP